MNTIYNKLIDRDLSKDSMHEQECSNDAVKRVNMTQENVVNNMMDQVLGNYFICFGQPKDGKNMSITRTPQHFNEKLENSTLTYPRHNVMLKMAPKMHSIPIYFVPLAI